MYLIKTTEYAEAARLAIAAMRRDGGWWWLHADEDEGFRMVRLGTPTGNRLARSGSPSIAGPYDASVSFESLGLALRKASLAERSESHGLPRPTCGRPENEYLAEIRRKVLVSIKNASLTTCDVAKACGIKGKDARDAIHILARRGEIIKTGEIQINKHQKAFYWRKVA